MKKLKQVKRTKKSVKKNLRRENSRRKPDGFIMARMHDKRHGKGKLYDENGHLVLRVSL